MNSWLILLGGLLVWTLHFFGLYAIGEIAPRAIWVVLLTAACIVANLWLLRYFRRLPANGHFFAWRRSVALGGVGLSLVAVIWQSLAVLAS